MSNKPTYTGSTTGMWAQTKKNMIVTSSKPIYLGSNVWWADKFGNTFRKNGPCIIYENGRVMFTQLNPGGYNRVRGPAIISNNGCIQYCNPDGEFHRIDGPAVIYADGGTEYWVDGNLMLADEFFLRFGIT